MVDTQQNKHKVFVYGSLKGGFRNHSFLESAEFLGTTYTENSNFIMFSFGHFPGVIKDDDIGYGSIEGELYLVDDITMFKLDLLESNGQFYTREKIKLEDSEEAWMYLVTGCKSHLTDDDDQIGMYYYGDKLVFSWKNLDENKFNFSWNHNNDEINLDDFNEK